MTGFRFVEWSSHSSTEDISVGVEPSRRTAVLGMMSRVRQEPRRLVGPALTHTLSSPPRLRRGRLSPYPRHQVSGIMERGRIPWWREKTIPLHFGPCDNRSLIFFHRRRDSNARRQSLVLPPGFPLSHTIYSPKTWKTLSWPIWNEEILKRLVPGHNYHFTWDRTTAVVRVSQSKKKTRKNGRSGN